MVGCYITQWDSSSQPFLLTEMSITLSISPETGPDPEPLLFARLGHLLPAGASYLQARPPQLCRLLKLCCCAAPGTTRLFVHCMPAARWDCCSSLPF